MRSHRPKTEDSEHVNCALSYKIGSLAKFARNVVVHGTVFDEKPEKLVRQMKAAHVSAELASNSHQTSQSRHRELISVSHFFSRLYDSSPQRAGE
jgi:hypothetical protein